MRPHNNSRRSVGGDDQLRLHGGQRSAEPKREATRDGDSANVSGSTAGHERLRHSAHAQSHTTATHWNSHR